MSDEKEIAALRMWLESPNLVVSYERHGIVTMTISLRQELAVTVARTLAEKLDEYAASGVSDPEQLETMKEVAVMAREVLGGGGRQVLPLGRDGKSPLDDLFGEVS